MSSLASPTPSDLTMRGENHSASSAEDFEEDLGMMAEDRGAVGDEEKSSVVRNEADRQKFANGFDLDKDAHDLFIEWIEHNGGNFPKLYLKEYTEGVRGVHTSSDIDSDEVIMRIPYKCCITVEMGKQTSTGKLLIQKKVDSLFDAPKHIFLMLFIMIDGEDEKSFFQPYYNILPTALSCMPVFWRDEEYQWLRGSYLLQQIQMRKDAIREDYNLVCKHDPSFRRFGLEYFAWARMIVCSRNFGGIVGGTKTSAMVPMADMLNHYRPRETRWGFREESKNFEISATTPIAGGGVVYDSYGKKCQHRFLLNYGFAVENNVEEDGRNPNELYVTMELLPRSEDACHGLKVKILERNYGPGEIRRGVRVGTTYKSGSTLEAWSFLRFIHLTPDELNQHLERMRGSNGDGVDISTQITAPVSIENETKCLKKMASLMVKQLQKYDTTYEEDLALLNTPVSEGGPPPFSNRRNALIYMCGEKEICNFYIDLMRRCVKYFTYDMAQLRLEMKAFFGPLLGDMYNGTAEYMTECVAPLLAHREWELREAKQPFQRISGKQRISTMAKASNSGVSEKASGSSWKRDRSGGFKKS